jgi:hypothetical protein
LFSGPSPYRPEPGKELEQGDIIELLPIATVSQVRVMRAWPKDAGQNPVRGYLYTPPIPAKLTHNETPRPDLFKDRDELIPFEGRLERCMVLSETCVIIEKARNQAKTVGRKRANVWPVLVAPVRPWPKSEKPIEGGGGKLTQGEALEQNRVLRYLGLPEHRRLDGTLVFDRCVVDLRKATPVKLDFAESVQRIASLTARGLAILQSKLFTFFSGKQLPDVLTCPSCGTTHPTASFLVDVTEEEGPAAEAAPASEDALSADGQHAAAAKT